MGTICIEMIVKAFWKGGFKQKPEGNPEEKEMGSERSVMIMSEIRPPGVLVERPVLVLCRKTRLNFGRQRNK